MFFDDDFGFLTGGDGDLNGDGRVNLAEYDNYEYDYNHIMGNNTGRKCSGGGSVNTKQTHINFDSQNIEKIKKRAVIASVIFAVAIMVAIVASCIVSSVKTHNIHTSYDKAERLIAEEKFDSALELLKAIEKSDYKDTKALINYCTAHKYYEEGDYLSCFGILELHTKFRYQSEEQLEKINRLKDDALDKSWEKIKKEESEKKKDEDEDEEDTGFFPSGGYHSKNDDDDPYNADDYAHPDDFYYDHYDDFFDYYEAEDYYNEHND